jgi:ankyrin repeat protein
MNEKNQELFDQLMDSLVKRDVESFPIKLNKYLANGGDINQKDETKDSLLIRASFVGDKKIFALLLDKKADINITDAGRNTPLHWAVINQNKEIFNLAIKNDANINALNKTFDSPLHLAVKKSNNLEMVNKIIEKKATIDQADINGYTPLAMSARVGKSEYIKPLLEAGADINAKTIKDNTPALLAVKFDNHSCARALIKYGAKTDIKNSIGQDAFHIAQKKANKEVVKLITGIKKGVIKTEKILRTGKKNKGKDLVKDILLKQKTK